MKVQVRLDEDATDQQIISSLDDACRAWSTNITTGAALRVVVGRLLVAIRARGIHKKEPWGTFDAFVTDQIEKKYGIDTREAHRCIELVTGLPDITPTQAKIPTAKLMLVAQAVNHAPPRRKRVLRERLLKKAASKDVTINDFRDELKSATLLRTASRQQHIKLATLTFQVPVEVAERWRQIVGHRAASIVFAEWVEEHSPARRKQPGKSRLVNAAATA